MGVLARLTPRDVAVRFYDDRLEPIPYNEPTDLVALTVETYSARRAYQIASEYRKRGVPVVMGGFHPTLVPEEALEYADAILIGEAEGLWPILLADFRAGRMQEVYRSDDRPPLVGITPDRSIFEGKRYLPVGLVEAGRGCRFKCEFCSVQSFFGSTQNWRPVEEIVAEIESIKDRTRLIFFVNDNITDNTPETRMLFEALIPLKIKWVSQASIDAARDESFLRLMKESGCQGVLIGFESLNLQNLRRMGKGVNLQEQDGYDTALANLRKYKIRIYASFILGYDEDTPKAFAETLAFARRHRFFVAAFNHLLVFPGTPLYSRVAAEGRLRFDRWWLNPAYRFGMVPFVPARMTPEAVEQGCMEARRAFYRWRSILQRVDFGVNSSNPLMLFAYWFVNALQRREVVERHGFPLGDEGHEVELIKRGVHV